MFSFIFTDTSFTSPSFSGSSYLMLRPFGNQSDEFYLEIAFHSLNKDGMLLFSSQTEDGTGQYISLAISNGHVEFRFVTVQSCLSTVSCSKDLLKSGRMKISFYLVR